MKRAANDNGRKAANDNRPPGRLITEPGPQVGPLAPPPGWTPEADRIEELQALSVITVLYKTSYEGLT